MSFATLPKIHCSNCNEVMRQAVLLHCGNNHHIDKHCAKELFGEVNDAGMLMLKGEGNKCPECRQVVSGYAPDHEFSSLITTLFQSGRSSSQNILAAKTITISSKNSIVPSVYFSDTLPIPHLRRSASTENETANRIKRLFEYISSPAFINLIDDDFNPNARNNEGIPLLHRAVQSGTPKVLAALLNSDGININATAEGTTQTALHWITGMLHDDNGSLYMPNYHKQNPTVLIGFSSPQPCNKFVGTPHDIMHEIASLLIEHGADEDIFSMAALGDLEKVKGFIEEGNDVNLIGPDGCTPLGWAARRRQNAVVWLLLSHGADVNGSAGGYLPIHNALRQGNLGTIQLLVNAGADINAVNGFHQTPVQMVVDHVMKEKEDILAFLLNSGADPDKGGNSTPLLNCMALVDYKKIIPILLAGKANPNLNDCNNHFPLTTAIGTADSYPVQLLIESGADVNVNCQTRWHWSGNSVTPVQFAIRNLIHHKDTAYYKIIAILIKNGCDLSIPLNDGTATMDMLNPFFWLYIFKELHELIKNESGSIHIHPASAPLLLKEIAEHMKITDVEDVVDDRLDMLQQLQNYLMSFPQKNEA